jgi:hypothetical protein
LGFEVMTRRTTAHIFKECIKNLSTLLAMINRTLPLFDRDQGKLIATLYFILY